jgi:DNA-directed RNA polymerase beta subunit
MEQRVKPGDILIGKITQRNQILLQKRNCFMQIFADKAGDVKMLHKSVSFFT